MTMMKSGVSITARAHFCAESDPMLSVETIIDDSGLHELIAQWDSLHERISPRLPFTTHLWASIWWQNYRRNNVKAKDFPRLFLLRSESGELVAVAPMVVTQRPGYGPFSAKELQFFGADSNVTEFRGPLCLPEHTPAVVHSISTFLDNADGADWVQWRGLRLQHASTKLPTEIRQTPHLDTTVHILRLPSSWEQLRANLSRNMKQAIRKCYNSLASERIAFQLRIIDKPEDVPAALDRLFTLHAARASVAASIKHPDVFASPVSRSFMLQYCTELARRGALRIFQLVINDEVVATRIGFKFGDELYLYYSGYDPRWGRYSVMTTVVVEAIKWAIDHKFRIVNLSTGADISKARWEPDVISYFGGFSVRKGYRSRALFDMVSRFRERSLRAIVAAFLVAPQLPDKLGLLFAA
ncbi:MAG: GNAT family N-acetyltransferase [Proteobacteria bacterium]|nr:GNAT family N-acetyltransferase [Pseudomonadota bacterium]